MSGSLEGTIEYCTLQRALDNVLLLQKETQAELQLLQRYRASALRFPQQFVARLRAGASGLQPPLRFPPRQSPPPDLPKIDFAAFIQRVVAETQALRAQANCAPARGTITTPPPQPTPTLALNPWQQEFTKLVASAPPISEEPFCLAELEIMEEIMALATDAAPIAQQVSEALAERGFVRDIREISRWVQAHPPPTSPSSISSPRIRPPKRPLNRRTTADDQQSTPKRRRGADDSNSNNSSNTNDAHRNFININLHNFNATLAGQTPAATTPTARPPVSRILLSPPPSPSPSPSPPQSPLSVSMSLPMSSSSSSAAAAAAAAGAVLSRENSELITVGLARGPGLLGRFLRPE